MLNLASCRPIAEGCERACYVHPEDASKCVKVSLHGVDKQFRNDLHYQELLLRRRIAWGGIPRFYGMVDTSLGKGLVFDLVRDYDGNVSGCLRDRVESEACRREADSLVASLFALRGYLLRHGIVTRDMTSLNMLYQAVAPQTHRVVLVDGVGNSDYVPLATYIIPLARLKMRSKWAAFERAFRRRYQHITELDQAFRQQRQARSLPALSRV